MSDASVVHQDKASHDEKQKGTGARGVLAPESLLKLMLRAARADVFRSLPFMPIYSAAEVALAFLAAALIRLVYIESPRVFVGDLVPEALQSVIAFPQTLDRKDLAIVIPLLIMGVGLVKLVTSFLSTYFMERAGYFVSTILREQLLARILEFPAERLQATNAAELSNRIMADSTTLQGAVSKGFLGGFRDVLVLIFCFTGMVFVAGKMFALILVCLLPFVLLVRYLSRVLQRHLSATATLQVGLAAHAMDTRVGLLTLAAERTTAVRRQDFARRAHAIQALARRTMGMRTLSGPFIEYLAVAGVAILLGFKNSLGAIDVSTYASLFILGAMTYRPLKNLGGVLSQYTEVRLTFERLNQIWIQGGTPSLSDPGRVGPTGAAASVKGDVASGPPQERGQGLVASAKAVDYVTAGGEAILRQVSLEIRPQEIVGFVGESGSGKTTMLRLLAGVLEPTAGTIRRPSVVRMATQAATVFAGSVRDNIAYDAIVERQELSDSDEHERAALVQNLGLAATPLGAGLFLERMVMPGGSGLSGGERARVALARVLATVASEAHTKGDRRLLLFDEPTANLDPETSELFWRTLRQVVKEHPGTSAVVITHHLKDLQHCHRHYRFAGGVIDDPS